jgi:hypothetical protein
MQKSTQTFLESLRVFSRIDVSRQRLNIREKAAPNNKDDEHKIIKRERCPTTQKTSKFISN